MRICLVCSHGGQVTEVIKAPDFTELSIKGRRNAWKKKNGKYIRATYLEEEARMVVVTVTLKDKLPGGRNEDGI